MPKRLAIAALLATATPAAAQTVQPWPDVFVTVPVEGKWIVTAEAIGRIADDSRTTQVETRLQFGRVLSKRVTVSAGWVHYQNYLPTGAVTDENQAVEQINWTVATAGRLRLLSRTRLEERFVEGAVGTNWRVREQVRGVVALGGKTAPSFVLWTEPFIALNHTAVQAHDLDQLRSFAGLNVPLSRKADIEFGYLNQRIYRPSDTLVNHCIPLILNYRF